MRSQKRGRLSIDERLATPEALRAHKAEVLFGQFRDQVRDALASRSMTQQQLAKTLDVSEGRISQVLSGGANCTLRSVATVAWGVDCDVELRLVPRAGVSAPVAIPADDPPAVIFRDLSDDAMSRGRPRLSQTAVVVLAAAEPTRG